MPQNNLLKKILDAAVEQKINQADALRQLKAQIIKAAGVAKMPTDAELLKIYRKYLKPKTELLALLTTRKIRTLSGVAIIAVLTKPYPCPGNCLYCPSEKAMPKSYLSNEPAVMRAVRYNFDPFKQVKYRLKALAENGHPTDKCELIVMGGTWSYLPHHYQEWFLKRCFDAFNEYRLGAKDLATAKKRNETAPHRVVGLTLETRPDYITPEEGERMRKLGATRIELGIQAVDDKLLKLNRRGHNVKTSIQAVKILRDLGFKLTFHLMPNLPGANLKKDLAMFNALWSRPEWRPDQIKIYPCVVTKNSDLYALWQQGKYHAYTDQELIKLLSTIKKNIPPYVRIARLIRDIPEESIIAGNKITNLRQILQQQGVPCKCLRCREPHGNVENAKQAELKIIKYKVLDAQEIFLSYADKKYCYAFCRLHLGAKAIIRELHTYGQLLPLGKPGEIQHFGFGKKLLAQAEILAKQKKYTELSVIAGVGVREYYRKLGYCLKNEYMLKIL